MAPSAPVLCLLCLLGLASSGLAGGPWAKMQNSSRSGEVSFLLPNGTVSLEVLRRQLAAAPRLYNGQARLALLRKLFALKKATRFFAGMDISGFTPTVVDVLSKFKWTFMVPPDAAWARTAAYFVRLPKKKQQQVIGYHMLNSFLTPAFLINVKQKTEFKTADYDYTVAKFSKPGAAVAFSQPKAKRPAALLGPLVFKDKVGSLAGYTISAMMLPPKFN